ncbi:MAG TPA: M23 family metallopeptidase [Anaerolineales bacterium]|nr:M23 family metallopeptidase [Anaerolineales bacterium]
MAKRDRKASLLLSLLFIGIVSGCNFPGLQTPQPDLTVGMLKLTLAAQNPVGLESTQSLDLTAPTVPQTTSTPADAETTPQLTAVFLPPDDELFRYYLSQPGDTLAALSSRFSVSPDAITPQIDQPEDAFLQHGLLLQIPRQFETPVEWGAVLPDSEVLQSPTSLDFDIEGFIREAGGYLSRHGENVQNGYLTGAQIIDRVASESSINPRFLLALLEFRSGWVYGEPASASKREYPIGFQVPGQTGLYRELIMVATHLNAGYYGWRDGSIVEMKFRDATLARIPPKLNAGSAAVQYLFSKFYRREAWGAALFEPGNFSEEYVQMFGDPWDRAAAYGPLFPEGIMQPELELPFSPGERWSLTGGPHPSWKTGSPRGAVDFAPVTGEPACMVSRAWVLAAASGLVVRNERSVITIDLDGDGFEQTGWVLLYYHIAEKDRIPAGTYVETDDPIGHPSCEGGASTGTHFHFARKYNGEWIAADGPLRMNLGGWQAYAAEKNYQGEFRNGEKVAVASPVGPRTSIIVRE